MCKILVADDEYLEREAIKQIVRGLDGAEIVGEGNSGRKAVELHMALKPHLIFINYSMGGLNGLDAAKEIRKKDKDVVIIMTSAYNKKLQPQEIQSLNINEYLLKPIKPSVIEDIVIKYKDAAKADKSKTSQKNKKNLRYYPKQVMTKEILEALEYIDDNYMENPSLETVAGNVYLSTYYFSRLFKKEVGVNFSSYIIHKKLDDAKRLLTETDKSILEISSYLNFKEQNYFCKVFKKNVGVTPTEYRNTMTKEKLERQKVIKRYL